MGLLLFSAISFFMTSMPAFDWSSPVVQNATFSRSIKDLFMQTNDTFGQNLTNAIVQAYLGKTEDLDGLAPNFDYRQLGADTGDSNDSEARSSEIDSIGEDRC